MDKRRLRKGKTLEEIGHKVETCQCAVCKTKRGECFGKDNSFYDRRHTEEAKQKQEEFMRRNNPMKDPKIATKSAKSRKGQKRLDISGKNHPFYGKKRFDHSERIKGERNPNWQNGVSFEPYGLEFNDELKLFIRQRDNFACQLCGAVENGRAFPPHHVNYNKKDSRERNLILLCTSCNSKANVGRDEWQFLFETLQEIRL